MSLTSILGRLSTLTTLSNAVNPPPAATPDNNLQKLVERLPKPFIFIQTGVATLSTAGANGAVIIQSPIMNRGERGVVRDLNVNFGTVAGVVKICKINSTQVVTADIVTGIAATTSGTGNVVLEEGEAIAIVITTTAATGTLGAFFSGEKIQVGI